MKGILYDIIIIKKYSIYHLFFEWQSLLSHNFPFSLCVYPVHSLAKASFLQDMLITRYVYLFVVFYLAKASFLQDMLLGMFVWFFILQKLAFCKICYSVYLSCKS
jgi:hypothetical protein